MKNTALVVALLTATLMSCTKENQSNAHKKIGAFDKKDYDNHLYYGVTDRQERSIGMFLPWWFEQRVGRISIWLMFKQDNYWSSRADYAEILFSDVFLGDIDEDDKVKVVDSTDNLAIKNSFTPNLLWKELTRYTRDEEIIPLKTWNYTAGQYLLKINGSNFPPFMQAFLHDKYLGTMTKLNVYQNAIAWFDFNVEGQDKNNGILPNDSHRFELIIRSDY